jgi:hypothetical protein
MLTDIEVRTQLAFAIAHDQNALASNVADHAVANVGELVCSAYVAPVFTENSFKLCSKNFGRRVFISSEAFLKPLNFWC